MTESGQRFPGYDNQPNQGYQTKTLKYIFKKLKNYLEVTKKSGKIVQKDKSNLPAFHINL